MKKSGSKKSPIYFRYEFSNEKGQLEGGDIFQFNSLKELLVMAEQALEVAHSDQVAVNFTIGTKKPFFGFLKNVGLTAQDIDHEMVKPEKAEVTTAPAKAKGKAKAKKKAKKRR